jgi:hypothetical protein
VAKEGYHAKIDEAPSGMPKYPFMVQWLLETYALDDDLSKAYMAATTATMLDGKDESAFGRRLHQAAIRAGNFWDASTKCTGAVRLSKWGGCSIFLGPVWVSKGIFREGPGGGRLQRGTFF